MTLEICAPRCLPKTSTQFGVNCASSYGENGFTLESTRNPHGLSDVMPDYFAGELGAIDALPVKTGGTPFQQEVWRASARDPLRVDHFLRKTRRAHRPPHSGACSGPGQRRKSGGRRCPVPSRNRGKRHRLPATAAASSANAGCSTTRRARFCFDLRRVTRARCK